MKDVRKSKFQIAIVALMLVLIAAFLGLQTLAAETPEPSSGAETSQVLASDEESPEEDKTTSEESEVSKKEEGKPSGGDETPAEKPSEEEGVSKDDTPKEEEAPKTEETPKEEETSKTEESSKAEETPAEGAKPQTRDGAVYGGTPPTEKELANAKDMITSYVMSIDRTGSNDKLTASETLSGELVMMTHVIGLGSIAGSEEFVFEPGDLQIIVEYDGRESGVNSIANSEFNFEKGKVEGKDVYIGTNTVRKIAGQSFETAYNIVLVPNMETKHGSITKAITTLYYKGVKIEKTAPNGTAKLSPQTKEFTVIADKAEVLDPITTVKKYTVSNGKIASTTTYTNGTRIDSDADQKNVFPTFGIHQEWKYKDPTVLGQMGSPKMTFRQEVEIPKINGKPALQIRKENLFLNDLDTPLSNDTEVKVVTFTVVPGTDYAESIVLEYTIAHTEGIDNDHDKNKVMIPATLDHDVIISGAKINFKYGDGEFKDGAFNPFTEQSLFVNNWAVLGDFKFKTTKAVMESYFADIPKREQTLPDAVVPMRVEEDKWYEGVEGDPIFDYSSKYNDYQNTYTVPHGHTSSARDGYTLVDGYHQMKPGSYVRTTFHRASNPRASYLKEYKMRFHVEGVNENYVPYMITIPPISNAKYPTYQIRMTMLNGEVYGYAKKTSGSEFVFDEYIAFKLDENFEPIANTGIHLDIYDVKLIELVFENVPKGMRFAYGSHGTTEDLRADDDYTVSLAYRLLRNGAEEFVLANPETNLEFTHNWYGIRTETRASEAKETTGNSGVKGIKYNPEFINSNYHTAPYHYGADYRKWNDLYFFNESAKSAEARPIQGQTLTYALRSQYHRLGRSLVDPIFEFRIPKEMDYAKNASGKFDVVVPAAVTLGNIVESNAANGDKVIHIHTTGRIGFDVAMNLSVKVNVTNDVDQKDLMVLFTSYSKTAHQAGKSPQKNNGNANGGLGTTKIPANYEVIDAAWNIKFGAGNEPNIAMNLSRTTTRFAYDYSSLIMTDGSEIEYTTEIYKRTASSTKVTFDSVAVATVDKAMSQNIRKAGGKPKKVLLSLGATEPIDITDQLTFAETAGGVDLSYGLLGQADVYMFDITSLADYPNGFDVVTTSDKIVIRVTYAIDTSPSSYLLDNKLVENFSSSYNRPQFIHLAAAYSRLEASALSPSLSGVGNLNANFLAAAPNGKETTKSVLTAQIHTSIFGNNIPGVSIAPDAGPTGRFLKDSHPTSSPYSNYIDISLTGTGETKTQVDKIIYTMPSYYTYIPGSLKSSLVAQSPFGYNMSDIIEGYTSDSDFTVVEREMKSPLPGKGTTKQIEITFKNGPFTFMPRSTKDAADKNVGTITRIGARLTFDVKADYSMMRDILNNTNISQYKPEVYTAIPEAIQDTFVNHFSSSYVGSYSLGYRQENLIADTYDVDGDSNTTEKIVQATTYLNHSYPPAARTSNLDIQFETIPKYIYMNGNKEVWQNITENVPLNAENPIGVQIAIADKPGTTGVDILYDHNNAINIEKGFIVMRVPDGTTFAGYKDATGTGNIETDAKPSFIQARSEVKIKGVTYFIWRYHYPLVLRNRNNTLPLTHAVADFAVKLKAKESYMGEFYTDTYFVPENKTSYRDREVSKGEPVYLQERDLPIEAIIEEMKGQFSSNLHEAYGLENPKYILYKEQVQAIKADFTVGVYGVVGLSTTLEETVDGTTVSSSRGAQYISINDYNKVVDYTMTIESKREKFFSNVGAVNRLPQKPIIVGGELQADSNVVDSKIGRNSDFGMELTDDAFVVKKWNKVGKDAAGKDIWAEDTTVTASDYRIEYRAGLTPAHPFENADWTGAAGAGGWSTNRANAKAFRFIYNGKVGKDQKITISFKTKPVGSDKKHELFSYDSFGTFIKYADTEKGTPVGQVYAEPAKQGVMLNSDNRITVRKVLYNGAETVEQFKDKEFTIRVTAFSGVGLEAIIIGTYDVVMKVEDFEKQVDGSWIAEKSIVDIFDGFVTKVTAEEIRTALKDKYAIFEEVDGPNKGALFPSDTVVTVTNKSEQILKYNANGGVGTVPADAGYGYGDTVTVAGKGNLTHPFGVDFLGWATSQKPAPSDILYQEADTFIITKPTTLYAQWDIEDLEAEIKYFDGGTLVKSETIKYGETLPTHILADKPAYKFAGWTVKDLKGALHSYPKGSNYTLDATTFDDIQPDGTILMYAAWEPYEMTVTYVAGNPAGTIVTGTAPGPDVFFETTEYFVLPKGNLAIKDAAGVGYDFLGWKLDGDTTNIYAHVSDAIEGAKESFTVTGENMTLTAQWQRRVSVKFDTNHGSETLIGTAPANTTVSRNETIKLPKANISLARNPFLGWKVVGSADGKIYANLEDGLENGSYLTIYQTGSADVIFQAQWGDTEYVISYYLNRVDVGVNSPIYTETVKVGANHTVRKASGDSNVVIPTGKLFEGWRSNEVNNTYGHTADKQTSGTYRVLASRPEQILNVNQDIDLVMVANKPITLKYNLDGGAWSQPTQVTDLVRGQQVKIPVQLPTKEHYSFVNWKDTAGTAYAAGANYTVPENLVGDTTTLTAQWKGLTYKIIYDENHDTGYSYSVDYVYPSTAEMKDQYAYQHGYTHIGWNTKADGSGTNYTLTDVINPVSSDMTLYAQWDSIKAKVNYYDTRNGAVIFTENVPITTLYNIKSRAAIPVSLPGEDKVFLGWGAEMALPSKGPWTEILYYASAADKLTTVGQPYRADATYDETVYLASFNQLEFNFIAMYDIGITVRYDLNGGTVTTPNDFKDVTHILPDDQIVIPSEVPSKEHSSFAGWNFEGTPKNPGETIVFTSDDHGVYVAKAEWDAVDYNVSYTFTQNLNTPITGTAPTTDSVRYGTNYNVKKNTLQADGYLFAGWEIVGAEGTVYANAADAIAGAQAGFTVAGNTVLHATWTKEAYTVTYDKGSVPDGTITGTVPVDSGAYYYGDTATALPSGDLVAGDGNYTFAGWQDVNDGGTLYQPGDSITIKGNAKLVAKWNAKDLTVTYQATLGASLNATTVVFDYPYGSMVSVRGDIIPTLFNHNFLGWSTKNIGASGTSADVEYVAGDTFKLKNNTILYTVWEELAPSDVDIIYVLGGGQASDAAGDIYNTKTVAPGSTHILEKADISVLIPPAGESFSHWEVSIAPKKQMKPGEGFKVPTNVTQIIVTAIYSRPLTVVPINYNGGSGNPKTFELNYGSYGYGDTLFSTKSYRVPKGKSNISSATITINGVRYSLNADIVTFRKVVHFSVRTGFTVNEGDIVTIEIEWE